MRRGVTLAGTATGMWQRPNASKRESGHEHGAQQPYYVIYLGMYTRAPQNTYI